MKESPRSKNLLKLDGPKDACPLCKLNMDIKYTVSLSWILLIMGKPSL